MNTKRGQAGIIITVVLILIVLGVIVVLWNVYSQLIKTGSSKIDSDLMKINLEVKSVIVYAAGVSKVTVSRLSGAGDLISMKFVFTDIQGNSFTITKTDDLLKELDSKTYTFLPISALGEIKSVSVFPVIGTKIGREFKGESVKNQEIPNGLVSWYLLDSPLDLINENPCNIIGGVDFIDDNGRKVARFNSGKLNCGNDSSLNINNGLSISLWFKVTDNSGKMLYKGINNINYQVGFTNQGNINFSYGLSLDIINQTSRTNSLSDSNWHHLVITNLMMYIDGVPDNVIFLRNLPYNTDPLIIGEGFNGELRDLMIFNKSLDINQARSLYNQQKQ